MPFNSWYYALFLGVLLAAYYLLPHKAQNGLLLIASYVFYAFWDWRSLALLLGLSVLGFFGARAIEASHSPRSKRVWLWLVVGGALGVLALFKYHGFFLSSLTRAAEGLGLRLDVPTLNLLLPVGLSFYTFHVISYAADVYRERLPAPTNGRTRNLLSFALYMAFFPKILSGPIERAEHFLPQVESRRRMTVEQMRGGLALILLGLFKKAAIANPLSAFIDPVFLRPELFTTPELIRAALFFALQIYCDFSAYTEMARGSSRLLGIELVENFQQPYLSPNITLFWRRWHMSLSFWLRDYLYIPLGGNRRGRVRTYANLMVTMLLGGLWHGDGWNYVVWGGLHGLYLSVHKLITGTHRAQDPARPQTIGSARPKTIGSAVVTVLSAVGTFSSVSIAWVFFRARNVSAALAYLRAMASFRGMGQMPAVLLSILIPWIPILAIDLWQSRQQDELFFLRWRRWARGAFYAALVVGIVVGGGTRAPFIYTQY